MFCGWTCLTFRIISFKHNVKTRFPFLYASLDTKTLTVASNLNSESCLSIHCLAPQHIFQFFSIFATGFSFTFGNFGHYCVVLLIAPLSDRDGKKKGKKRFCNGFFFLGNLDPSSLTPGGPVVPLVCSFRRRDNLLTWRVVCEPFLWAKISHLILGGIQPLWTNL